MVLPIAGEEFISAVPGQGDDNVLPCLAADVVGGKVRVIGEGLVEVPEDRVAEDRLGIVRRDDSVGVLRRVLRRHLPRPRAFVVALFLEADREGADEILRSSVLR